MAEPQPSVAARRPTRPQHSAIQVEIDGLKVPAFTGESVAAVLLAAGFRVFSPASRYHLPRTIFCGMGVCQQCLVTVDGKRNVRACMTKIQPGMKIETRNGEDETQ